MVFSLERFREKTCLVVFVGVLMGMVICSGTPFPPLVAIRESPEFSGVVNLDKSSWPRCLLWHGWLPALSGCEFGSPWAEGAGDAASKRLEVALGFLCN